MHYDQENKMKFSLLKTPIFFFFIPFITLLYALLTPHLNYVNTVHADFSFPSLCTQMDLLSKRNKHIPALRDLLGNGEIESFFKKLPVLKNHKTCRGHRLGFNQLYDG